MAGRDSEGASRAGSTETLLKGLTGPQRAAVMWETGPLCVLAGAGSGKTTVLTRRVARRILDGSADPEHSLVVTFTRKAASEVRSRLCALRIDGDVRAGTFHGAAYSQLRRHWADHSRRPPKLLGDPSHLLGRLLRSKPDGSSAHPERTSGAAETLGVMASLTTEIHWARARLVAPSGYAAAARAAGRTTSLALDEVARNYERYEDEKRRRGLIDLDDLIDEATSMLERDERASAVEHWRTRHFFVDEFQDLNPAQWRLLRAWLGQRDDIFVVGDPLQAVYGWNGSDPSFIERIPELVPQTHVIRLDENHRSTAQIVLTARSVLGDSQQDPAADAGRTSREGEPPIVASFDSEQAEAHALARWLRRSHRPGRTWSQMAVLARTNARLEVITEVLGLHDIPYRLSPAKGREPSTRRALTLLRSARPSQSLRGALADVVVTLQTEGQAPETVTSQEPVPRQLLKLVDDHAAEEPGSSVGAFLSWMTANSHDEEVVSPSRNRDAVELTTFHKAKGLEWSTVAVVGLEDGMVPITYASTPEALAEERRLLYVALTRAESELWCSWASTRETHGRTWSCDPSPFVDAILTAVGEMKVSCGDLELRRARLIELRSKLRVAG